MEHCSIDLVLLEFQPSVSMAAIFTTKYWCQPIDPKLLSIGQHASIGPEVEVYNVDRIDIGNHCTISMQAMLCTGSHDISDRFMALTHAPIRVEEGAWVCARAFVGPGVVIGKGAVVAACAVVSKDVAAWNVVVGNPATFKKVRRIEVPSTTD